MRKWSWSGGARMGDARAGGRLFLGGGLCEALTRACALGTMSSAKLEYSWDPIHNGLGAAAAKGVGGAGSMPCRVGNVAALDALLRPHSADAAARLGVAGIREVRLGKVLGAFCSVEPAGVTATSQPSDHYPLIAQFVLFPGGVAHSDMLRTEPPHSSRHTALRETSLSSHALPP